MPDILKAKFRIVTPMFIGSASQDTSDGIRPPSVKGALRFWWRALNWGRFRSRADDDGTALRELHKNEAQLFGSAAQDDGGGGQGCFLLRTMHGPLHGSRKGEIHKTLKTKDAARYLGYGLMEAFASKNKGTEAGQLLRACVAEGQEFTVRLVFRRGIIDSVQEALTAWGLLGGLGSRARHGFGSVALEALNGDAIWTQPKTRAEYVAAVEKLVKSTGDAAASPPPFSAFSKNARVDILPGDLDSPFDTLDAFGFSELMYRSWGRAGKVLRADSEMNFAADHDWAKDVRPKDFHPRRVIFGLPHNYGKGEHMEITPANHDRRASPLFFHVHPAGSTFIGVSILLPSVFLPRGEKINAGGTAVPSNPDWTVLTDFLDGKRKSDGKPRFAGKYTIFGGTGS